MSDRGEPFGSDYSWDDIQKEDTGVLVHIMLCNFIPVYSDEPYHMQTATYMAAYEELNKRLKR